VYTDTLFLSRFLFLSLAAHGKHLKRWNLCYRVSSEKPDERGRNVRQRLDWLKESVNWCSAATNDIVLCHAHFAYLMARQINGAADLDQVIRELAKDMATASSSLSKKMGDMKSDLAGLISALEEIEVKKNQSTTQRILGWLEGFLFQRSERISNRKFVLFFQFKTSRWLPHRSSTRNNTQSDTLRQLAQGSVITQTRSGKGKSG